MVTANLSRLKVYLCDKPTGGTVGKGLQVMAYPWLGDGITSVGKIIGIDADNNGTVDLFLGNSPEVLDHFLANPINAKLWGKPTAIPRGQLTALTSHCEEWTAEPLSEDVQLGIQFPGAVVFGLGVLLLLGAAIAPSYTSVAVGVMVVGVGIAALVVPFYYSSRAKELYHVMASLAYQTIKSFMPE